MIAQGTVLDDTYRIVKSLGSGGGGEIYLADHLRLEKPVVIKKIKDNVKGLIASRGEADILKKLRHPYLPQVSDYFIEDNQVYTVMEYIEGESFQQLLDAGKKFAAKDIIKWGTQLSEVLVYLHSQTPPIIHRDIKPANIMLTPEGNIRLIDFNVSIGEEDFVGVLAHSDGYSPAEQYGIMRESGIQKEKEAVGGTDETQLMDDFMPQTGGIDRTPQQSDETEFLFPGEEAEVHNEKPSESDAKPGISSMMRKYEALPRVDERSDIYSLGATLYHLITLKRPPKATEPVVPLSECSDNVGDGLIYIIDKAMQRDPSERFQSAAKMHDAFVNIKKLDHVYISYARKRDILFGAVIALMCCSIICTALGYKRMGADEYNSYVAQMEEADAYYLQGQMQEASEVCGRAIQMRPDDLTAYVEMVQIYYMWQKYDEGIATVKQIEAAAGEITDEEAAQWGTLQFLAGECYMELNEHTSAAECYQKAITYQPEEGEYYTRCAIALARDGRPEEAEAFLEGALQKDISDAAVSLTKAEIMLGEEKYEEAEALINEVLKMTQDSDLSYHAYLAAVSLYENGANVIDGALEKEKELLETAVEQLGSSYALSLSEKLGDIYYELAGQESNAAQATEYYEKARACFQDIYERGYQNLHLMQNLAVINQTLENYEEAESVLLDMVDIYPEDYRGYMYLTLLYSEIQNKMSIEKRDYSTIFDYYERAETLYQRALGNGESVDANMQILEGMIGDLREVNN